MWHTLIATTTITVDGRVPGQQTVIFDGPIARAEARHRADAYASQHPGMVVYVFVGKGTRGRLVFQTGLKLAPNGAWVVA